MCYICKALVCLFPMNKKLFSLNLVLVLLAVVALFYLSSKKQVKSEEMITVLPSRQVYTGAWVGGFWENKTKTLDVSKLTSFEDTLEAKMAIANFFADWTYLSQPKLLDTLNEISKNGWTPMITSNPLFFENCKKGELSIYGTIASGACDQFLKEAAQNLHKYNKRILLRFAWEMNLPSIWWSTEKTNSTTGEFIDAWRHIHTILKDEGATNVEMVLAFNTSSSKTVPYTELYPGDDYVEWVGIDGYNWGTSVSWSKWTSFDGVFKKSYDELSALTKKPIMLSEVNSSSVGGNKAAWLDDMLNVQIPYRYHNVKAVVFFNENKSDGEGVDWRLERSQDNVFIVKAALKNKLYRQQYP